MKTITFRKLYERVKEGYYTNALIAYSSYVWIESRLTDTDLEDIRSGGIAKVEKGYEHRLFIDLWLIHLRFSWKTGYRPSDQEIRSAERSLIAQARRKAQEQYHKAMLKADEVLEMLRLK